MPQSGLERFGEMLRRAREEAGLSVREIARRVGLDATYLSRLERGLAGPPTWAKIAILASLFPGSALAKAVEARTGQHVRDEILQSAKENLDLLLSLPGTHFEAEWARALRQTLTAAIAILDQRVPHETTNAT